MFTVQIGTKKAEQDQDKVIYGGASTKTLLCLIVVTNLDLSQKILKSYAFQIIVH